MRLALTGGGTGGHVYPALEVGRLALDAGDAVMYAGSLRGIEGGACAEAGIPFFGCEANPIPKLASVEGLSSVLTLLRTTREMKRKLQDWRPDVVLATGGYASAAPLRAAKALQIPIVLHEQNSVPGRAIKMMGQSARKICTVFKKTGSFFPADRVVETGMPIRRELIDGSRSPRSQAGFVTLAMGGSQGARRLNQAVVELAQKVGEGQWIHIAGPKLYEEVLAAKKSMPAGYELESFLDSDSMAAALSNADIAIARSGCGTIAELAAFGVPAIYIPLPTSFANHQLHNAQEIEALGGGRVIEQQSLTPELLRSIWLSWRGDTERRQAAARSLRAWAKPDAAHRVLEVVKEAAR